MGTVFEVVIEVVKSYSLAAISTIVLLGYSVTEYYNTFSARNVCVNKKRNVAVYPYYYGGKEYKLVFPVKAGMLHIKNVVETSTGDDVTDDIREFLGFSKNFHGIPTSPKMLGYESLTVTYIGGQVIEFTGHNTISLKAPTK